jgi:DNA-binding PadR family transcriptional regulator
MQALVYLAIRDPSSAHVDEDATDTSLRLALRLDQEVIEELLDLLEEKGLLVRKLPGLEEPLIALTPLGAEQVALWLERTRSIFSGWPPDRPDVDDVVK